MPLNTTSELLSDLKKGKMVVLMDDEDRENEGDLILPEALNGITAEMPPPKFDSDISTNVAMVLSKINKKSPIDLANTLSEKIKKKDKLIEEISIEKRKG